MNGAYFTELDQLAQRQLATSNIVGCGTTDYILFSLNVASNADISYGLTGTLLASGGNTTTAAMDDLVGVVQLGTGAGQCQQVWLSVGGHGASTFANIQAILAGGGPLQSTLMANLNAIIQLIDAGNVPVGFELDYAETGDPTAPLVAATLALYNQFQCAFTFRPYGTQARWIDALQQIYTALGKQPVAGFNLRTYADNAKNDPAQWSAALEQAQNTGVASPAYFVWPVFSCDSTHAPVSSPAQVTQGMGNWRSSGASLWSTAALSGPGTLAAYATAIARG